MVFKGFRFCLFGDVGKRSIKGSKINVSQSSKLMSQLVTHFPSPTTLVAEATRGWCHSWSSIWFCFFSLFLSLTNFGTAQIFLVLRKLEIAGEISSNSSFSFLCFYKAPMVPSVKNLLLWQSIKANLSERHWQYRVFHTAFNICNNY